MLRFININKTFIEGKKMINLEDIDTKENLIQDFYRWLFDNNNVVDKSVILEKEVDISKNVELIFNIFALDINERKLISKLYMELEKLTADERFYVKTQEMKQYLQEYLLQLEQETDYILDLADEIDFASLFKAFGIKYEVLEENFLERLVRYMRIVERLLKKKLFVFVNLRSYLSNQQIDELIKEATYQEIQLLLIETCARDCIEGVTRYIIDKDGCEI